MLRAQARADDGGVGGDQHAESAESNSDRSAVEVRRDCACFRIDLFGTADAAVLYVLVAIVVDLHHLVARCENPAQPPDLADARLPQEAGHIPLAFTRAFLIRCR